jgi:hypothetical protein
MCKIIKLIWWSTPLGGQRSWVVNAAGWSTQMNDLTAFSTELNENDFFDWVGWERLFRLGRMGTTFSTGSDGNGFFD